MKCTTVRTKLAGYLDDAITGAAQVHERVHVREHLESCASCREELQRFRKLAVLLSRVPRSLPPRTWQCAFEWPLRSPPPRRIFRSRLRTMRDRAEVKLENVFRPLTLPATGGFVSAILVFVVVLQLIVPGITVARRPERRAHQYFAARRTDHAFGLSAVLGSGATRFRARASPRFAPGCHRGRARANGRLRDSLGSEERGFAPSARSNADLLALPPHAELRPAHRRRPRDPQLQRRPHPRLTRPLSGSPAFLLNTTGLRAPNQIHSCRVK